MNLSTLPDLRAAEAPDAPAVADDTINLNNTQFFTAVRQACAVLDEKGVSVGDVVAIMLPNRVEFVVAMFAAWRLGAAVTPISPTLVPAEAAYQIEDAAAKVVIVDMPVEIDAQVEMLSTNDLTAGQAPALVEPAEHRDDALALLIYTSGTTGRPKGVMLDHANLDAMCAHGHRRVQADRRRPQPAHPAAVPRQRDRGQHAVAAGRGRPRDHRGAVQPENVLRPVEQCGADLLLRGSDHLHHALRPARRGAPGHVLGPIRRLRRRTGQRRAARPSSRTGYGIPLIEGYGLSEGTCASTGNPLDGERKPGTVGLPLPGQTIRIVAPDKSTFRAVRPARC